MIAGHDGACRKSACESDSARVSSAAVDHAVRVIHNVCYLAGSPKLIAEIRNDVCGPSVRAAITRHDTPPLFDWLIAALSYQGISDQVAYDYMQRHGCITWADIDRSLSQRVTCPKLRSYWHFYGCRYQKSHGTCAEPNHISRCPVPTYNLRNGRLNQTAYGLYLFIRDLADGDLVGWIDAQLDAASAPIDPDRLGRMRDAVIGPLRNVHGLSDKVLAMALSCMLLAAAKGRPHWREVGVSLIAIDTLVHNFLHRTGILGRFAADHAYGPGCYRPGGCADIVAAVSDRIDAREFGRAYPKTFPRFVQYAIWRYCSEQGLDICNGNRIDDRTACTNASCGIYGICDKVPLKQGVTA